MMAGGGLEVFARGSGRTTTMLRGAIVAARCEQSVLVVMLNRTSIDLARESLAKVAASLPFELDGASLSRMTFVTAAEEHRLDMRGRRFDVRFVDHAVADQCSACRGCSCRSSDASPAATLPACSSASAPTST